MVNVARGRKRNRGGSAAVEMAFILPFLLTLIVGIWEIGNMIQVTQVLEEATREGARLAASGCFTSSNSFPTMISPPSTGTGYEVQRYVILYLQQANVKTTYKGNSVTVTVNNTTQGHSATYTDGGSCSSTASNSGTDPAADANPTKVDLTQSNATIPSLDSLTVSVNLPYSNVNWDQLNWFGFPNTLTYSMTFCSLKNIPLTFSTTIPTIPAKPGS